MKKCTKFKLYFLAVNIILSLSACGKPGGQDYVTERLEEKRKTYSVSYGGYTVDSDAEISERLLELYEEGFEPELTEGNINSAMIKFEQAYYNGEDAEYAKAAVNDSGELILSYIYAYNADKADHENETRPAGGSKKEPDWYIGVLEYNLSTGMWDTRIYKYMSEYYYVDQYTCRYLCTEGDDGQEYLLFGYVQGSIQENDGPLQ